MNRASIGSYAVSILALLALLAISLARDPPRKVDAAAEPEHNPATQTPGPVRIVLPPPLTFYEPSLPSEEPVPHARPSVEVTQSRQTATPVPQADAAPVKSDGVARPTDERKDIIVDQGSVATGRVLLRMITEGKGPQIEIAWPDEARDREHLYRLLVDCYGLRTAVLTKDNLLFRDDGAPGIPWSLNRDIYSDFLRQPDGKLSNSEKAMEAEIRSRHGVSGATVRILPRTVDAGIAGALFQLAGGQLDEAIQITARYKFDSDGLLLSDIVVANQEFEKTIHVPIAATNCRY